MTPIKALVLAIFAHLTPGAERAAEPAVVDAISVVGDQATTGEVALLSLYAWYESRARVEPVAWSWDAHASVSCGAWQEPCAFVRTHSVVEQARYWLRELRTAGLRHHDIAE